MQHVKIKTILDKGRTFLDKGDVAGYWKHMSQVTDYARLAGDVASGDGLFAHLAKQSLQRAARVRAGGLCFPGRSLPNSARILPEKT